MRCNIKEPVLHLPLCLFLVHKFSFSPIFYCHRCASFLAKAYRNSFLTIKTNINSHQPNSSALMQKALDKDLLRLTLRTEELFISTQSTQNQGFFEVSFDCNLKRDNPKQAFRTQFGLCKDLTTVLSLIVF